MEGKGRGNDGNLQHDNVGAEPKNKREEQAVDAANKPYNVAFQGKTKTMPYVDQHHLGIKRATLVLDWVKNTSRTMMLTEYIDELSLPGGPGAQWAA